jgi:hypothetical protein
MGRQAVAEGVATTEDVAALDCALSASVRKPVYLPFERVP